MVRDTGFLHKVQWNKLEILFPTSARPNNLNLFAFREIHYVKHVADECIKNTRWDQSVINILDQKTFSYNEMD